MQKNKINILTSEQIVQFQDNKIFYGISDADDHQDDLFIKNNCLILKKVNKIIDQYETNMPKLGEIKGVTHNINKIKPMEEMNLTSKSYPIPMIYQVRAKNIVKELLDLKVIRPSQSNVSSPAFFVDKKDTDDLRMVVNFKVLNQFTKKDPYPLPKITDQLNSLSGYKIFTLPWDNKG